MSYLNEEVNCTEPSPSVRLPSNLKPFHIVHKQNLSSHMNTYFTYIGYFCCTKLCSNIYFHIMLVGQMSVDNIFIGQKAWNPSPQIQTNLG